MTAAPVSIGEQLASAAMAHSHDWRAILPGKFIVFDGPDGSGKSTQFRQFAASARGSGVEVVEVREPGGSAVGEKIRDILLDPVHTEMAMRAEMLLYMASRAQLVEERIRPALARGACVLADRFISSTLAYQGSAGGIAREDILAVGKIALSGCWPDLVAVFDVDPATAHSRMARERDRIEQRDADYHARVRRGYLDQAAAEPSRYLVIDSTRDPGTVFGDLCAEVARRLVARPSA